MKTSTAALLGASMAAILAASAPALAADVYERGSSKDTPVSVPGSTVNWTGIYLGIQGGYGSTTLSLEDDRGGIALDGLMGGVRAGADIQRGAFVFGAYAEYNVGGQALEFGGVKILEQDEDWAAMLRLGIARGNTLYYVAGGYTQVTLSSPIGGGGDVDVSGWKWAGGLENMFAPNTTFAFEASYAVLDPDDISAGAAKVIDLDDFRVMGRLNYRFGGDRNFANFGF